VERVVPRESQSREDFAESLKGVLSEPPECFGLHACRPGEGKLWLYCPDRLK